MAKDTLFKKTIKDIHSIVDNYYSPLLFGSVTTFLTGISLYDNVINKGFSLVNKGTSFISSPFINGVDNITNTITKTLGMSVQSQQVGKIFLKNFSAVAIPLTIVLATIESVNTFLNPKTISPLFEAITKGGKIITNNVAFAAGGGASAALSTAAGLGTVASVFTPVAGGFVAAYLANSAYNEALSFVNQIKTQKTQKGLNVK